MTSALWCSRPAASQLRVSDATPLPDELASAEPTPSAAAEASEAETDVLQALDQLPANQQEVIRLKFQNGLSYREISRITELSVSNVGFLIHTGIKTLRQRVRALEGVPHEP